MNLEAELLRRKVVCAALLLTVFLVVIYIGAWFALAQGNPTLAISGFASLIAIVSILFIVSLHGMVKNDAVQ